MVVPPDGYLTEVRALCSERNVLMIADEIQSGLGRTGYTFACEHEGVQPDVYILGKALGGGYPIGAFCGSAELMALVREDRLGDPDYMWVASTLGGNPVSTAAACAALAVFRQDDTYTRLHALGETLRAGMRRILRDRQMTAQVIGDGPLAQIVFSDRPVRDYRSTQHGDGKKGRALMLALFRRGVFLNPMGTKLYLSLAHDESVCGELLDRLDDALSEVG